MSSIKAYRYFLILYMVFLLGGFILWWETEHGFLIHWWSEHRTDFWTFLFGVFDRLGEEWGYLLFGLIFFIKRPYRAITIGLGGLAISIVIQILKFIFSQPRPLIFFGEKLQNMNVVDSWHIVGGMNSLPSGHTAGAFTLVTIICFYSKNSPVTQVLLVLMAVIAGMARIYGVNHFLIDILIGSMVGILVGFFVALACEKWLPQKWKEFKWSFR